jgi:hypothetical protein
MILCRQELSSARRLELADKLRTITGWPRITFDDDGRLRIGGAPAHGGSATARNLIRQALSGNNVILLEDASNRLDVVFSSVAAGRWKSGKADRPSAFVVLLDFADFDHLIGDQAALNAFDAGWAFLHEIDHVANGSVDATKKGETGECENHINRMRRECNLPLRADYFFTYFPYAQQSNFRSRLVRLAFDFEDTKTTKRRRYWVMWDALAVGGVVEQKVAKRD